MRPAWHFLMFLTLISGTSGPAYAETIQISIDKMVFLATDVKAKVGDTVEWVNADILAHTATIKGGWDVVIPSKETRSAVMKKAGTFEYYCRFHPNMMGRIAVSDASVHGPRHQP
jgi:plastocyanin